MKSHHRALEQISAGIVHPAILKEYWYEMGRPSHFILLAHE